MGLIDTDDPLSKNTARLSISTAEGENQRNQVREFLKTSELQYARRDSAVSISSFNDDEEKSNELRVPSPQKGLNQPINGESAVETNTSKRRRSSAHSIALLTQKKKQIKTEASNDEDNDEAKSKRKKHKKKLQKALALAEIIANDGKYTDPMVKIAHIRSFILDVFIKKADIRRIPFKLINRKNHNIVFCFIPGISKEDFGTKFDSRSTKGPIPINDLNIIDDFEFFKKTFDYLYPSSSPGSKDSLHLALQALINVPLTDGQKNALMKLLKKDKIILPDLTMSKEEMQQHNYPMHSSLLDNPVSIEGSDWVETKDFDHEGSHTFSLDCEFCQSANGKVLTRISIIDFDENIVLDTFVKPDVEITDYLTKYSGITEAKLEGVTTTLKEVQERFLSIVSSNDILIGQSLESDLNVLKIKHPKVIDTALIYDHTRGPPMKPSLKWLSEKHLGKLIQQGEANGEGHSSVEDSKACLRLVKMKLIEGKLFGKNVGEALLFENLNEKSLEPLKSSIIDYTPLRDWDNTLLEHNSYLIKHQATNDDEVVDFALKDIEDGNQFTILKLRELEYNSGWSPVPKAYDGYLRDGIDNSNDKITSVLESEERSKLIRNLNERLNKLYSELPENTIFIINTVMSDPREVFKLQSIRRNFQNLQREGVNLDNLTPEQNWTFDKRCELGDAVESARTCMTFINVKRNESIPQPDIN